MDLRKCIDRLNKNDPLLTSIDLNSYIGVEGAKAIAHALSNNKTLTSVDL